MKFATILIPGKYGDYPASLVQKARLAEETGWDVIGIADSQSIAPELYPSMTVVAEGTDDIAIGPLVSNCVTRHPAVTASGMAAIDEISGGRGFLGVGSGDSSVETIGERRAKLDEMGEYISACRTMFDGDVATYEGNELALDWIDGPHSIPTLLAADGPNTLGLAGKVADGVIIGSGVSPEIVDESLDRVEEGAEEAGRDVDDVETWLLVKLHMGESREAVIDEIKSSLVDKANMAYKSRTMRETLPEEYREPIEELRERYNPHEHVQYEDGVSNDALVEELGLVDFLADRFVVAGTPAECRARVQELADRDDIDGALLANFLDPIDEVLETVSDQIVTRVE